MMLHTEPSFSVYADEDVLLDNNKKGDLKVKQGSGEFSFANDEGGSGFENLGTQKEDQQIEPVSGDEDPSNPLFLKNHAHLLQSNGDLNGAEEYYFCVTQTDPEDGESLMQYAKLVWELHRDKSRASAYFERAVHAAPEDCNVLAAYASFLWEIDEDEENDVATSLVETKGDLEGAEEYYSHAIQADPGDGEVISQYAQLVWELHRDQDKAAGYFEQAVKAAPANSHVLAAHAKFLWEAEDEDGDEELGLPLL